MAYNLQSLITILEKILNPKQTRWILDDHSKPQLQSLLQKSASLQQILENSSLNKIDVSLKSEIRDAAHQAEDIIENYMVDQMLSSSGGVSSTVSTPDLHQVTQQLDSAMEQVAKLVQGNKGSSSTGASFLPNPNPNPKIVVVGVDEDLLQLKDRLTGMQRKLEIIPIVGMGGIGKTTIARKLYQDSSIISRFQYARAWATVSQDYDMKAILTSLLRCVIGKEEFDDRHIGKESDELRDVLYQSLYGRRYMIVLDDMWSTQAWDDIRRYFPDNNNGSRILITSRESDVGKHADSQSVQHEVQLLSESESWNLLRQIVFEEAEEDCPDELQGIGEKIASDCGGLPLALNVIGGILSKVERSGDVWESVGNDVRSAIFGESVEQFSNILSLSYDHLPNHLKPCFLYVGAFPEDHEIKASRLVRMWVAEGFVKLRNGDEILEEEAEDYIKALVERNLLLVRDFMDNGKPKKRYNMHDLLRDLCIRKAEEEKFLHLLKNNKKKKNVIFSNVRRVSVHTSYGKENTYPSLELMFARSFICTGRIVDEIQSPAFWASRLLRVLDLMETEFSEFPREILQLVNLRYLAICSYSGIPCGISRLLNLQTLIVLIRRGGTVPSEIWEMSELRHLKLTGVINIGDEHMMRKFVEKELRTISYVGITATLLKTGFLESIPHVRNMKMFCRALPSGAVVDLSHLHKLQTLTCTSQSGEDGCHFLPALRFPCCLKKLSLYRCMIFPVVLTALCALPNLEILSLDNCNFEDDTWEAEEGHEFRSLRFLIIKESFLVRWRADETNFPRLRHLRVQYCSELEEIPSGFGDIPTLQLIELEDCSPSAEESAKRIQEVQQSEFDNYDLHLRISHKYAVWG